MRVHSVLTVDEKQNSGWACIGVGTSVIYCNQSSATNGRGSLAYKLLPFFCSQDTTKTESTQLLREPSNNEVESILRNQT